MSAGSRVSTQRAVPRPRANRLATVVLAVLFAGCEPAASVPTPTGAVANPGFFDVEPLRYTCGEFPFDPAIFDQPGTAEQEGTPQAAALRAQLAPGAPEGDWLPNTGWHLVGQDADSSEFAVQAGQAANREIYSLSVEPGPAGWKASGWGGCRPALVMPAGIGTAEWRLDPADPVPGPDTRVFGALVTERACASGELPVGRVVGPAVVAREGEVRVVFGVRTQPGGHNCPSNPSVRVLVDLGELLGDRALVDPVLWPATDVRLPDPELD